MSKKSDDLLTLQEVAAELRIGYETARQLTVKGKLPWVPVGSGTDRRLRRVRRETLERFKRAELIERTQELIDVANQMARSSDSGAPSASYY